VIQFTLSYCYILWAQAVNVKLCQELVHSIPLLTVLYNTYTTYCRYNGRGDRLSGCPTTNNLLINATSNQSMLQIPNISQTSASSCISYSLNPSFSSLFQFFRHSPLPHSRYDLRPSMILHHSHFHVNCYSLSLSTSCQFRVITAKQNLKIVVSSIQPYLNRR